MTVHRPIPIHRLHWPHPIRCFLKMDDYGGLPEWWQWPIPRYGRWGGVGWSAGRWLKNGEATDWCIPTDDEMDTAFRDHDKQYRVGGDRLKGDDQLVRTLQNLSVKGMYANLFRVMALMVFSCRLAYLRWRYR